MKNADKLIGCDCVDRPVKGCDEKWVWRPCLGCAGADLSMWSCDSATLGKRFEGFV